MNTTKMTMTMNKKMKLTRNAFLGTLAVSLAAAGTFLSAGSSMASSSVEQSDAVDYRAPGVSFQQFGKAAKALVEDELAAANAPRWTFTRAFAWAAYEYTYNRPNYDRWVAKLTDPRLQEIMQIEVQEYVAAGRPPIAGPMAAADDALASYNAYRLSNISAAAQ